MRPKSIPASATNVRPAVVTYIAGPAVSGVTQPPPGQRLCHHCYLYKPFSEFYLRKARSGGQKPIHVCKQCAAHKARAYRYGIDADEFTRLLDEQDHRCSICTKPFERGRDTHVDHDHTTGAVRGLLCSGCNTGIGALRHDVGLLRSAIEYLELAGKTDCPQITSAWE
jgi:hypothetical protein